MHLWCTPSLLLAEPTDLLASVNGEFVV